MNKKIIWAIIALFIIVGLYFAATYRPTIPVQVIEIPVTNEQQPATAGPVLKVNTNTKLGNYLVAENGSTLYRSANDKAGISNCSGTCATNWPPYIVPAAGALIAEQSITGKVGTIQRADKTIQLTYNGMPLYFWSKDTKAGDTNGNGFNTVWSIVKP